MRALITGASSGIGREMAKYLDSLNCELILVARNKEQLESLSLELKHKPKLVVMDLLLESNVKSLYVLTKNEDIDILINNAGFGSFGKFTDTDLANDLEMVDLNVKTLHILTKMFLKDMRKKDKGYILNVASSASFQPGPLMATYYSTKAYVLHLTEAIWYELKNKEESQRCEGI